jgi:predicted phage terminase large subunit-like protein
MPEAVVAKDEKTMGLFGTAAQHQMRPMARGGETKLFSRPRFERNIRDEAPHGLTLVRYWDKAFTSGGGAYTVGVLMGRTKDDDYWILDVKRGQWGNEITDEMYDEAKKAGRRSMGYRDSQIYQCAVEDKAKYGRVKTWLEHEPGPQGRDSCAVLIKLLAGFPVEGDPVKEDKTVRAESYASQQQAGNVYLLRAPWNEEFMKEHEAFPESDYKDQVDASSGAFNKVALGRKSWRSYSPVIRKPEETASGE